jgi:hypothetical protein
MRDFAQETLLPVRWTNGNGSAAPQRKLILLGTASDPGGKKARDFAPSNPIKGGAFEINSLRLRFPARADYAMVMLSEIGMGGMKL